MVVVSYSGKEINAKLVYYGAGLSGKTTNLEAIYEAVPETSRGKMVSMKTQSDRTLFFDLLPLDLGEIMGFKTRFLLYTVPGQVFYNATRKLVLKGADGIVFVADSAIGKMDENKESLANLKTNLSEYGLRIEDIPWVLQYNKRDLPNVYSVDELNAELNPGNAVPFFEAVATQGGGVFETFRGISHLLMQKVTRELHRSTGSRSRGEPRTSSPSVEARTDARPAPAPASGVLGAAPEPASRPAPAMPEPMFATPAGLERPVAPAPPVAPARAMASDERATMFDDHALSADDHPLELTREVGPRGADDAPLVVEREPSITRPRSPASGGDGASAQARFEERTLSLDGAGAPAQKTATIPAATATAPAARQEIVVPITLGPGGAREIVLRITFQSGDGTI